MAVYSKFLSLISGAQRTVDLSTNTLSLQGLQINAATGGGALTQAAHSATSSYTIVWPAAQAAMSGYVLSNDGAGNLSWMSGSAGSVTSVALSDGSTTPIYSISGSPVTSSGTLTFTLSTQSANSVFAGPATGSAAQPTFRSLVAADIPSLAYANQTLSNLTSPTSINQDLIPSGNLTRTMGSVSDVWSALWIKEILYPSQIDFRLDEGFLYNSTGSKVVDFTNDILADNSGNNSIDWNNRLLIDASGSTQASWSTTGLAINTALALDGSTSGALTQNAAAVTTPYTITWPAAQASGTQVLQNNGSGTLSWASAATGSVTSIAFADDSTTPIYGISGSPITSSGTLAITLETQSANTIFAGPSSGSDAQPTFRALVAADIPSLDYISSLIGDGTTSGFGTSTFTLATVNSNIGTFGSSTSIPSFVVNAKGLITGASGNVVIAPAGTLSGSTLNSSVTASSLTSLGTQAQALDMGNFPINNVQDPLNPQDAATKHYVDLIATGIEWKDAVQAISVSSNVPLTGSTPLVVDGYTALDGDSLILDDQTTAIQNGVYTVAISGGSYTLTLRADSVTPSIGFAYLVENGTDYANSGWRVNAISPNTTFIQFTGPQELVFNAPLSRTGNDVDLNYSNGLTISGSALVVQNSDTSITVAAGGISVNLNAAGAIINSSGLEIQLATSNPGLAITSNHLDVKYNPAGAIIASASGIAANPDGSTLDINGSNQLEVKAAGIGTIQLASASVTVAKLATITDGITLDQSGSGSTLEIKAAGVSATQLATGAFDQATITGGAGTPASVVYAPAVEFVGVAGQTFSSTNTTYAVRWGITGNSETANRLYAADITTSSFDLFYVIGTISIGGSTVSAGASVTVTRLGSVTLGSSDPSLTLIGQPVYLSSAGALTQTAPSTTGQAVTRVGILHSSTAVDVNPAPVAVN